MKTQDLSTKIITKKPKNVRNCESWVRCNLKDKAKYRFLIARDTPEQVRKTLGRIRRDEPSNAVLTKLMPFLSRDTTERNIRMHETEATKASLILLSLLAAPLDPT